MDLRQIKVDVDDFGLMSNDPAFLNTASCRSAITFIDGGKGILRYRGYPIEQLAEQSTFVETAYLLLEGNLPTNTELATWHQDLSGHVILHENIKKFMEGFRYDAHPMGIFLSTVGALSTFYPKAKQIGDPASRRRQALRLIAKVPSIAAYAYRHSVGKPYVYPDNQLSYTGNFLSMLFKRTEPIYRPDPVREARARFSCSSCTPITSRTAARARCAASAARMRTRMPQWPARRPLSTARCTVAPTRRCSAC